MSSAVGEEGSIVFDTCAATSDNPCVSELTGICAMRSTSGCEVNGVGIGCLVARAAITVHGTFFHPLALTRWWPVEIDALVAGCDA